MFFMEFLFDSIMEGWLLLLKWFIPEEKLKPKHTVFLHTIVLIVSAIMMLVFLFGVFVVVFTDAPLQDFWIPIFLPLGISALQIGAGIILRISARIKSRNRRDKDD
ncbi:MAG: hypothetical protein IKV50_03520 [Clostridia bacterium]|nr:hypothetical protein [Clostridia bacterium]